MMKKKIDTEMQNIHFVPLYLCFKGGSPKSLFCMYIYIYVYNSSGTATYHLEASV